jgi:hypothetical protein
MPFTRPAAACGGECLADFDRILAAHGIREHRACLSLRLIEGQQRTVLPDPMVRRLDAPVARLRYWMM